MMTVDRLLRRASSTPLFTASVGVAARVHDHDVGRRAEAVARDALVDHADGNRARPQEVADLMSEGVVFADDGCDELGHMCRVLELSALLNQSNADREHAGWNRP